MNFANTQGRRACARLSFRDKAEDTAPGLPLPGGDKIALG